MPKPDEYLDATHYPRIVTRGTGNADGVTYQVVTLEYADQASASEAVQNYRDRGLAVLDAGSPSAGGVRITVQEDGTVPSSGPVPAPTVPPEGS